MGVATGAAQFSRSIGGTVGVSVMGAILAAGPAGRRGLRRPRQLGTAAASGSAAAQAKRSPPRSIPIFVIGVPLMAITLALVALIPELPLRRGGARRPRAATAREHEHAVAA